MAQPTVGTGSAVTLAARPDAVVRSLQLTATAGSTVLYLTTDGTTASAANWQYQIAAGQVYVSANAREAQQAWSFISSSGTVEYGTRTITTGG